MVFIRKVKVGDRTYLSEVESIRVGNKIKQRFIRYVGREVNGERMYSGSVENIEVTNVRLWAPLIVLDRLAKKIQLSEFFGDYGDYLLSLAYAHCIEPKNLNNMEEWYQRTDLHNILNLKEISEKKLYHALDSINGKDFESVQKKIFSKVQEVYKLKPKGYFFDVTNVYFYGTECSIARKGHNKEGTNNPQIQIGLAVTKEEGIPILHKSFEGNIFDARILQEFLVEFQSYNIEEITLVWDRGCTSDSNIIDAKRAGFEIICGLAIKQDVKKNVDKLLSKKEPTTRLRDRIRLKNTIFYCTKKKYTYGNTKGYIILCHNEEQARINKEKRIDNIYKAQELIRRNKPVSEELKKYFNNDNTLNEKTVQEAQKYDGYSVIFSSKNLSAEEIVKPYFEKDRVEKAFRSLKSILGLKPIRHWLEERVKAHVFICYLSYLLLSLLESRLKKINLSATKALDKLSTSYKVSLKSKSTKNAFEKIVTLTKEQEQIIRLVDKTILKLNVVTKN